MDIQISKEKIQKEREELKIKVQNILDKWLEDNINFVMSYSIHKYLMDEIKRLYPKVASDEYSIKTKIYFAIHCLEDFPKCKNEKCNNTFEHKNVLSISKGFRKYCCKKCVYDSSERKRLYVETCKTKYGVHNISQYEGTKQKKKQKALDKYGVDNVAKAPEVQKTITKTNLDRYGATTYLHSKQGEKHKQKTCIERYGVDSFSKTPMHKEKTIATNQRKFGIDFISQDPVRRKAFQKRYKYNRQNFDSIPELAYYIWLKDNKIQFEYQPNKVFFYEFNEQICRYEPDFFVEGQYIELKGDHFFENRDPTKKMINPYKKIDDGGTEAKHQCMIKNNVVIFTSKDYKKYIDYVKQTYGKDYLRSFKNK